MPKNSDAYIFAEMLTELYREKDIVLPGDDDSAFIDLSAYFETDAIVREEDEFDGVPTYF